MANASENPCAPFDSNAVIVAWLSSCLHKLPMEGWDSSPHSKYQVSTLAETVLL